MANKTLPTPEELRQLLDYDSETGVFTWKARKHTYFTNAKWPHRAAKVWNAKNAGERTFKTNYRGYRVGGLCGAQRYAHRVAWAFYHGKWPTGEIDHINGVRDDNRISNLREVTPRENSRNTGIGIRNKSGVMGVSWCRTRGKWRATIRDEDGQVHLGYFDCQGDAAKARKAAEVRIGFHPNHGR